MKVEQIMSMQKLGLMYLRKHGMISTLKRVKEIYINPKKKFSAKTLRISANTRKMQQNYSFEIHPCFLILVTKNTHCMAGDRTLTSIQAQTYQNWKVCDLDTGLEVWEIEKKIESENWDYICVVRDGDELHESALFSLTMELNESVYDMLYSDEIVDKKQPLFKPDYSPVTINGMNYIGGLFAVSRKVWKNAGIPSYSCSDPDYYDFVLRCCDISENVKHIPQILYYREPHKIDAEEQRKNIVKGKRVLEEHLKRRKIRGTVEPLSRYMTYRIRYDIEKKEKVSILIPNKDHIDELKMCIQSIMEKTTYPNYEIIIIENNSQEEETFSYYESLSSQYDNMKIVYWKKEFNYSAINNFGASYAEGNYLILLNNDITIITPGWMEELLMFAQNPEVGAVGAMLYYPDDTIQHAGVILGIGGIAGHSHKGAKRGECGYANRLLVAQNVSCVTAACLMVRKSVFEQVNGLDENLAVAFNDVDFCMKVRQEGYLNIFTPFCELYHYESKSRGKETSFAKMERFQKEINEFQGKWAKELDKGDPYYNENLTLAREDFSYK